MGIFENIGSFFKTDDDASQRGRIGRNDPCWCGSGKKYKKCHLIEDEKKGSSNYHLNCRTS